MINYRPLGVGGEPMPTSRVNLDALIKREEFAVISTDKEISLNFFQNYIPLEQVKSAERTRKLVKESVGSYQELKAALRNPDNSSAERVQLAKNVFGIAIQLQWVVGDSA